MKVQINLSKTRYAICLVVLLFSLFATNKTYAQWQGSGTESSPYLIYTPSDMQLIATTFYVNTISSYGVYFKLMNDLDFSNNKDNRQIGAYPYPFMGKFDGNYKVIRNFELHRTAASLYIDNSGLFGYTYPGFELKNLGLENANVTGGFSTGLMVGRNIGIVENCYVKGIASSFYSGDVGGFCGKNDGTIKNSYAIADVRMTITSQNSFVGGFVGKNLPDAIIQNCYSVSNVVGDNGNNYSGFSTSPSYNFCSKNYYNDDWSSSPNSTSNTTNQIGTSKTRAQMQLPSFVDSLNNALLPAFNFSPDTTINNGFPILNWQSGDLIITDTAIDVEFSTAKLKGKSSTSTQYYSLLGFHYKEVGTNNLISSQVIITSDSTFEADINNLAYNKEYEYRAYGDKGSNIDFGEFKLFKTKKIEAITLEETDLFPTSTKLHGIIISGTITVISSGFEFKKKSDSFYNIVSLQGDTLSYDLTGLEAETPYVYRAFLSNQFETIRGNDIEFTTKLAGLNDKEANITSLLIYPNPAENNTNILIQGVNSKIEINIYDIQGRIIKTETINPVNNQINSSLDVSNLSKGIYFINISNSSFNKTEKLIIKD